MSDILSFDQKLLLLKAESTYNTDPTPAAGTDAVLGINMTIQFANDEVTREFERSFQGARPSLIVNERIVIEFTVELAGSGTADSAPAWAACMLASGHAETVNTSTDVQYNPVSSSFGSASIYFNINTHHYEVTGCRGTIINGEKGINTLPTLRFRFEGYLSELSKEAIPSAASIDYSAFNDPIAVTTDSWAVTLNSTAINLRSLTWNYGANIQNYEGSESKCIAQTARNITGEMLAFAPDLASLNVFALAAARTQVPLSSTVGSTGGAIVQITAPKLLLGRPIETSIDGAHGLRIPFSAQPDSGNDEWITITK